MPLWEEEAEEFLEQEAAPGELFRVFGLPVTVFSVLVTLGAALALLMALRRTKRTGVSANAVLWFALTALPLGVLLGRLVFCLNPWGTVDLEENGFLYLFRLDRGGVGLAGVAAGVTLAGLFTRLITKEGFVRLMDTVLPGLLILLAFERFAEGATDNGTGLEASVEALKFFPLVRPGLYGEDAYAVNLFAAVTALTAGLCTQFMQAPAGRAAGLGVIVTACGQIVWESIRRDERMMLMMASFLLVFCGAVLFAVFLVSLIKVRWPVWGRILAGAGFLILAAGVTLFQFAMEGKVIRGIPLPAGFLISAAGAVCLGVLCTAVLWQATRERPPAPEASLYEQALRAGCQPIRLHEVKSEAVQGSLAQAEIGWVCAAERAFRKGREDGWLVRHGEAVLGSLREEEYREGQRVVLAAVDTDEKGIRRPGVMIF